MTTPAVGRIVHYVSRGSADGVFAPQCRAAVITELCDAAPDGQGTASLAVLNPTGMFFDTALPHDAGRAGGTWHWYDECAKPQPPEDR